MKIKIEELQETPDREITIKIKGDEYDRIKGLKYDRYVKPGPLYHSYEIRFDEVDPEQERFLVNLLDLFEAEGKVR